jgi:peptide chain release factor 1
MSLEGKLQQIKSRHEELSALMAQGDLSSDDIQKYSREFSELTPVVEAIDAFKAVEQEMQDLEELMNDPDMKDMASEEYYALKDQLPGLEHNLKIALLPKDEADSRNAILEIRAGTGGDEAALFASDLFAMYKGYASSLGWRMEVMEASENDLGGYKEIIVEVSGQNVFSKLKYESGGHRVQRIPVTESGGRIHTSAATVAVLPEAEEVDVNIEDKDLRIDVYRASGAGGQHVNKTESAVRITHLPTGTVVAIQDESSQHKNKAKAMKILASRILEQQREQAAATRSEDRKLQVGSGDRSERIRTYNFPQGRVTDHRINLTLHKLDKVITGEALGEIIDALIAEDQAAMLADFDNAA